MRNLAVRNLIWMAPALVLAVGCGPGETDLPDPCDGVTCGLNAQCVEGTCECDAGFAGNAEIKCEATDACAGVTCGANASCSAGACRCDAGYEGDPNQGCAQTVVCTESNCNGNGACEVTNGAIACECDEGYAGATCSRCASGFAKEDGKCVASTLCDALECTENGSCVVDGNVASCECAEGWAGELCDGCAEGYSLDGTECVKDPDDSKWEDCKDVAPDNATSTVEQVLVTYDEGTGEWSEPAACEWECDEDFDEDAGECVDTRTVACDSSAALPPNGEYDTTQDVEITYTSAEGWTAPAACPWTCTGAFVKFENQCVAAPVLDECRLITDKIEGRSDETFVIKGELTVSSGNPALMPGDIHFMDWNSGVFERPVVHVENGLFEAEVTNLPVGSYDFVLRFRPAGTASHVVCGLDGKYGNEPGKAIIAASSTQQIESVRAGTAGKVEGVFVTVVVPDAGDGATRFFVQATPTGPALYVDVASAPGLNPEVGDKMSFAAESVASSPVATVTTMSGFEFSERGTDIGAFVQDLTDASDLVAGLDGYESELVELKGVMTSTFVTGDDFWVTGFRTVRGEEIEVRVAASNFDDAPEGFLDTLDVAIENECEWVLRGPMWRNGDMPQPTFYDEATGFFEPVDFECLTFFGVTRAESTGNTEVTLTFTTQVDPASLADFATKFVFDPPLAVTDASPGADDDTVVLTTASQTGDAYEVTVSGLTDVDGRALRPSWTTAEFGGTCDGSSPVVISQVYGAGGNGGAAYNADFIELFNRGAVDVDLTGWSVQYLGATGSGNWQVTALTGTIPAGGFYLIAQSGGATGADLPTPDDTGTSQMAATAGKVALVHGASALSGACPEDIHVVDFVGYGTTANCFEGAGPTPAPSATHSAVRVLECEPSTSNDTDFASKPVAPRNSEVVEASCANVCVPD